MSVGAVTLFCRYYGNSKILACLLLKPPEDEIVPSTDSMRRLAVSSDYDQNGGMTRVKMTALPSNQRLSDEFDISHGFPPRRCRFSAVLAAPPVEDWTLLHRILEKENAGKKHWLENTGQ